MDYDDQTIGRIFTRRQALVATARAGLAASVTAALGRSAWGTTPATTAPAAGPTPAPAATRPAALVATPQLTEGPFFVDERLNRSDLVAGTDRPTVALAPPLWVTFTTYQLTGTTVAPLAGAYVDVWNADAHGVYSDEDDPMNPEVTAGQRWLRGYQVTDAAGRATFKTIVPAWYDGRTAHVHFKVRQFATATGNGINTATTRPAAQATAEFTSQLFFPDQMTDALFARAPYASRQGRRDVYNADDGVFTERLSDGSMAGSVMTLDPRPDPSGRGYTAAISLYLTDASLHGGPAGRRGPGGPGGGPGGPPPDGDFPW